MNKKYITIKQFLIKAKISKSTIYRFYKKNVELKEETKKKEKNRMIPIDHIKYFNSEILFDENKLLQQENRCMKNLINCLVDMDSLQRKLWTLDWDFFTTVAYKTERNKKSCFKMMNGLYDFLIEEYGDNTEIRLFFTTEPYNNRKGFHNHFVLYVKNKSIHNQVIESVKEFFSYDRVDFQKYDKYKAGLFYIAKEGLVNEDWDILGNNLKSK